MPKAPDIPGLDEFAGETVHTARWDDSVELAGKRVAVIGTGASAVQLIAEIAPDVEHLTVFQRTPIWCLPKYDFPLPDRLRWALEKIPGTQAAMRVLSQTFVELTFPLAAHYHDPLNLSGRFEGQARAYVLRSRSTTRRCGEADAELPARLQAARLPQHLPGHLQPRERDARDRPDRGDHGERSAHGGGQRARSRRAGPRHRLQGLRPGQLPQYPVSGRGGEDLERFWRERPLPGLRGRQRAGFPQLLPRPRPLRLQRRRYFNLVETQSRHIVRALAHARENGATSIEVTAEANERYFAEMLRRRSRQVFCTRAAPARTATTSTITATCRCAR